MNPTSCPTHQSDCPKDVFDAKIPTMQQEQEQPQSSSSANNDTISIVSNNDKNDMMLLSIKCSTENMQSNKNGRNEYYDMCYPDVLCCFGQGKSNCEDKQCQHCHMHEPHCYDVLRETLNNQDEIINIGYSSNNKNNMTTATAQHKQIIIMEL